MNFTDIINFLNSNAGVLSTIFSGIVMFATVVYAVLTASLVNETRRMREVQTEPKIEVIAIPNEESVHLFTLRVRNIGLGPAYDVRFKLSGESNSEGEKELIQDFSKSQFLVKGLKYFGPGQELHSRYTQINQNFDAKIAARLIVEVSYRSATKKSYSELNPIYLEEYTGYGKLGTPHLYSIAQSLKAIEQNLGNITSGYKRLPVDIYTESERQKENEEWEQQLNQNIAVKNDLPA